MTHGFTNDQIPGYTGVMMDAFTIFASFDGAEAFSTSYTTKYPDASVFGYAKIVTRADGKFIVAIVDDFDETFFYAIAN